MSIPRNSSCVYPSMRQAIGLTNVMAPLVSTPIMASPADSRSNLILSSASARDSCLVDVRSALSAPWSGILSVSLKSSLSEAILWSESIIMLKDLARSVSSSLLSILALADQSPSATLRAVFLSDLMGRKSPYVARMDAITARAPTPRIHQLRAVFNSLMGKSKMAFG